MIRFGFAAVCLIAMFYIVFINTLYQNSVLSSNKDIVSGGDKNGRFFIVEGKEDEDDGEEHSKKEDEVVIHFTQEINSVRSGSVASPSSSSRSIESKKNPNTDLTIFMIPQNEMIEFPMMTSGQWHSVVCGVLFVTFTCPALSNYALFQIDLGTCLTLTSLGPLFSIPLVYIIRGEVVSKRGMSGACLSVIGVAIMAKLRL